MNVHQIFLSISLVGCTIAAITDLRTRTIPNWLTLGLFAAAPLARAALALGRDFSWSAALTAGGYSLLAGLGSALLPALLQRAGGLGMGDVKLFAAIGAACGAFVAVYAQTYAYVVAFIYAVVWLARRGMLQRTLRNVKTLVTERRGAAGAGAPRERGFTEIRFAPAILAGMCIAAWTHWRA